MIDRFYCPDTPRDGRLTLEGDEARHLARVRRVAVGQTVEVFNGRGSRWRAEVLELGRDRVELIGVQPIEPGPSASLTLTLASAFPKGERVDWLVEKATEIGVTRLIPLTTARSVVDPRSSKVDRLRRAVIEASKQSRRDVLLEIDRPTAWADLVARFRADDRWLAHPGGEPLGGVLPAGRGGSAILAIGPEGGFDDAEVDLAVQAGWRTVDLGPTTLRVETAGLAGASVLLALAGIERGER